MEVRGKKRFQFFDDKNIEELHMKAKYGAPLLTRQVPVGQSVGVWIWLYDCPIIAEIHPQLVFTCSRRESQLGFKACWLCKPKTTNTTSRGTRLVTLMAARPNSTLLLSTIQLLGCLDLVKRKMTKVIKTSKTLADLIQKTTSAVVIHHVSPLNSQSNVLASTM